MAGFIKDETPWNGGWVRPNVYCLRAHNASPMTYVGTNTWIVCGEGEEGPARDLAGSLAAEGAEPQTSQGAKNGAGPLHVEAQTENAEPANAEPEGGAEPVAPAKAGEEAPAPDPAALPPATRPCLVIDPAPEGSHVQRIREFCQAQNLRVVAIALTHNHPDHTAGAQELAAATSAPVYARAVTGCFPLPDGPFAFYSAGCSCASEFPEITVFTIAGHSADSVALTLPKEGLAFTGDVVFRHGPTVVFYPDGNLGQYLETLDSLQALAQSGQAACFLPGHGYPIEDPISCIEATRAHRLERLDQIKDALAAGTPATSEALFSVVYQGVDPRLKPASLRSIRAQLVYLGYPAN